MSTARERYDAVIELLKLRRDELPLDAESMIPAHRQTQ